MAEEANAEKDTFEAARKYDLIERLKNWLKNAYKWIIGKSPFNSNDWSEADLNRMSLDDFNAITMNEFARTDNSRIVVDDTTRSVERVVNRGDIRVYEKGLGTSHNEHSEYSERNRREAESERLVVITKQQCQFITLDEIMQFGEETNKDYLFAPLSKNSDRVSFPEVFLYVGL